MRDDDGSSESWIDADARELELVERLERLEGELARVSSRLDGASVTLASGTEWLRAPSGPDPARELQRIVLARSQGGPHQG